MSEDPRATALIAAVTVGDADTVRRLVREDPALASARDRDGLPVVLLALFHQQHAAADALLEAEPELGVLEAAATGLRTLVSQTGTPRDGRVERVAAVHHAG